jgi:predicted aconitase
MSKKRRKKHTVPPVPQQYEDRVEKALHALAASVSASQHLTTYMAEQLGPQWAELDHLLEAADRDMEEAQRWLRSTGQLKRSRARTRWRSS